MTELDSDVSTCAGGSPPFNPLAPPCPPPKPCRDKMESVLLPKIAAWDRCRLPCLSTELRLEEMPCCAEGPCRLLMVQQSGVQPWWEPVKQPCGDRRMHVCVRIPVCCQVMDACERLHSASAVVKVETALRLKARYGGTVTVGTMGPPQAQAIIREAYMMGADEGYVFSDRRLGGADVLATSYTLSQAIQSVGDFDLILCGKQTTDGDTAQVGPAIAEHMGIPHAAWVSRIDVSDDGIDVEQQLQDVIETVHMPFPCLVTVEQDIFMPRLPSLKVEREIREKPIHIQGLDTFLDTDPSHYGLSGSPTQVERIHGVGANSAKYRKLSEAECAALRCELGYAEDEKILLCTGELLPNKNQITAIRAMDALRKKQPNVRLLLAGNGPTLPELQAEVTALGLQEYVEFLGYRTDLERYANIADVIVSCSYREGLPMNIVEGMLLGKPVAASYNRGHRELIVPDVTGYMVSPADADAFAERISILLGNSALTGRMGHAGYEKAQLYADTNVRQELQAVYEL